MNPRRNIFRFLNVKVNGQFLPATLLQILRVVFLIFSHLIFQFLSCLSKLASSNMDRATVGSGNMTATQIESGHPESLSGDETWMMMSSGLHAVCERLSGCLPFDLCGL